MCFTWYYTPELKNLYIMKKLFTLVAALLMMSAANAQSASDEKVKAEGPNYVDEFYENYVMTRGVSADGTYIYGNIGADVPGCIYNVKTNEPMIVLDPEKGDMTLGVNVVGITYDGLAFVNENDVTYVLNLNDGTKTYLKSPVADFGMDVWDVTSDGSFFAGNITSEDGFYCEPLYGEKQEDGTFKMVQLDYPREDAMGCMAQFSQARFVSEDGNHIFGIQADARGMAGRLLVWTRQADGTFTYEMPFDDIIFDKSVGQPGSVPEFEDYVTADSETDPDLFNQQYDEFIKAFEEFQQKYNDFTRHSALDIFMMNRARRSSVIYAGLDQAYIPEGSEDYEEIVCRPIMYDCETGTVTYNEQAVGHAFDQLPGGGYITFDNSSEVLYQTSVVKEDGTVQEFSEWLNELCGIDLSEDYYMELSNPFTGQEFVGVFVGLPYFSNDGKTLVMAATDLDFMLTTGVITFDRDVFAMTATGIKPNVVSKVLFANNKLNIGDGVQGKVVVYNASGAKCGEFDVNGTADLSSMGAGAYIVNVNTEKGNSTLKVIVR